MWLPTWGTACPKSGRRLQAVIEKACPKTLAVPKRRLYSNDTRTRDQIKCPRTFPEKAFEKWSCCRYLTRRGRRHTMCDAKPLNLRVLQQVQHPVSHDCTNFNAKRRLQAVQPKKYKCPFNIEGVQCFLNNTNKKCA